MKNPCVLECTGRSAECHATCGKYKAWVDYNEKRKQWLKAQMPMTSEGVKKREIENLRRKAKYGNRSRWGRSKDE